MTDNFGSETSNRDAETSQENADVTQDSQDPITEEPSAYEFSDEASDEDAVSEPPARRSPVLPVLAALGGVALLGSVAWWSLSGNGTSSLPLEPPVIEQKKPATPALKTDGATKDGSDLALQSALTPKTDSLGQKETTLEGMGASSSSSAVPSAPTEAGFGVKPGAETPMAAATPAAKPSPAPEFVPLPPPAPVAAKPAPAAQPAPATPSATNAEADRRIDMLTARVDSLQKALDQVNQQLGQLSSALTAVPAASASSQPSKELLDRLDRMEQKMAAQAASPVEALPSPAASPAPAPVLPPTSAALPSVTEATTPVVKRTHKTVSATKHKTTAKTERKASRAAASREASKESSKEKVVKNMVLRAATPNQAWVSSGPLSHDLKEVHVGDTLRGIGRVTAIEAHGDKWILRGTKGSIQ